MVSALSIFLSGCNGASKTAQFGLLNNRLQPCPEAPNCVSSTETDTQKMAAPFHLQVEATEAWATIVEIITARPRTHIISVTDRYLHAECRSAIFGFIDDLELLLHPELQLVTIRSAARLGYYDFGVNRKRVEDLRLKLNSTGLVR